MELKFTFSNMLVLVSLIVTVIAFFVPGIYAFGINNYFLDL